MSRKRPLPLNPWQELEEQAYHAYREWPVFLKLRLRQLRGHLPRELFAEFLPKPATAPEARPASETKQADIALLHEYGLLVPEATSSSAADTETPQD